jgi:hypothetical protein
LLSLDHDLGVPTCRYRHSEVKVKRRDASARAGLIGHVQELLFGGFVDVGGGLDIRSNRAR